MGGVREGAREEGAPDTEFDLKRVFHKLRQKLIDSVRKTGELYGSIHL